MVPYMASADSYHVLLEFCVLWPLTSEWTLSRYFLNFFRLVIDHYSIHGRISSLGLYWDRRIWIGIDCPPELIIIGAMYFAVNLLMWVAEYTVTVIKMIITSMTNCWTSVWSMQVLLSTESMFGQLLFAGLPLWECSWLGWCARLLSLDTWRIYWDHADGEVSISLELAQSLQAQSAPLASAAPTHTHRCCSSRSEQMECLSRPSQTADEGSLFGRCMASVS